MPSQRSAALTSLVCFILGAAIALTASYGTGFRWWDYPAGLKILAPGVAIGIAGVASGALWLTRALRGNDSLGWKFGAVGLAGSLLVAGIPLNEARLYFFSPPIHEVTTDPEFPPPFIALLGLRAGAQNGPEYDGAETITYQGKRTDAATAQKIAYPDIKPYVALLNPRQERDVFPDKILFWRAFERAKDMGWNIVFFDEKQGRIEATHRSFWFGLVQDISIRVKPAGRIGAKADIRAKSRTGANDMGATAELARAYLKALK